MARKMSIQSYSKANQEAWRNWLEQDNRPRNLGKIQIYEHIATEDDNNLVPVYIDEAGNLYVGDRLALVNKKMIPVIRHNVAWGLSHTPYRDLYGMPDPYTPFARETSPIDVNQMHQVFDSNVNPTRFVICYWISYVLHQRQVLKDYISGNGQRLKWVNDWADSDRRTRKTLMLFP
jgi:hypothetical protein